MNSFFSSILDTVRVWLGLDHDRPYPSQGWTLRQPVLVPVRVVARPLTRGNRR
jgi:hypothetical protein